MHYTENLRIRASQWKSSDSTFLVEVEGSPAGEHDPIRSQIPGELGAMLGSLVGKGCSQNDLLKIGDLLGQALFPDEIRQMLIRSLDRLGSEDDGLRIQLSLDDLALDQLPWEYTLLSRPGQTPSLADFLALNPRVSIVRYERQDRPIRRTKTKLPLRLVAAFADAVPGLPLNLDRDMHHLHEAVDHVQGLIPDVINRFSLQNLRDKVKSAQIFHFGGHGIEDALVICNEEANGEAVLIPAEKLAKILSRSVRLAVFAACETGRRDGQNPWGGIAATLTKAGIPAVVAMQYDIADRSATSFSSEFYKAIAAGMTVDEAVILGRLAIMIQDDSDLSYLDFGVPVLYTRDPSGEIFPEVAKLPDLEAARTKGREQIRQHITHIVNLNVGTIQAGEVNIAGIINKTTINNFSTPQVAIDEAVITAYLEAAKEKAKPDTGLAYLHPLWNLDFFARLRTYPVERKRQPDDRLDAKMKWAFDTLTTVQRRGSTEGRIVALLGHPGQGKTPALDFLRRTQAQASLELTAENERIVPIIVNLKELRDGLPMIALVRTGFNSMSVAKITTDQVASLIERKRCLLLLDGLDRLIAEHNQRFLKEVNAFIREYNQEDYVITCDISVFQNQILCAEHIVLNDLEDWEVRDVISAAIDNARLYSRLPHSLRSVLRNRAMLAQFLQIAVKLKADGQMEDLYRYASMGHLVRTLTLDKLPDKEQRVMLEGLLRHLAFELMERHWFVCDERQLLDLVRDYLEEWREPWNWREASRMAEETGIMQRDPQSRQWRFTHRREQAYLAAAHMLGDRSRIDVMVKELMDPWWRETCKILIGLIEDDTERSLLLERMVDRSPLVAGECMDLSAQAKDSRVEEMLIDRLAEQLYAGGKEDEETEEIVAALGRTYGMSTTSRGRAWQSLVEFLELQTDRRIKSNSRVMTVTAHSLWKIRDAQGESPFPTEENPRGENLVRRRIIEIIENWVAASRSDAKSEYTTRLIQQMNSPAPPSGPLIADEAFFQGLAAVALGFLDTEVTRPALRDRFLNPGPSRMLAWCITEGLCQVDPDSDAAKAVEKLAQDALSSPNPDSIVSSRALYLLGWVGRSKDSVDLILDALKSPETEVRGRAVQALGRLELPVYAETLDTYLVQEKDPWVINKFAQTLGKIGGQKSLPLLEEHLQKGNTRVRVAIRRTMDQIKSRTSVAA